jgi:hypothetical protein
MERKADLLKELGKASKQDHNHQETILTMIQRLSFFATSLFAFEIRPYNPVLPPQKIMVVHSRYGYDKSVLIQRQQPIKLPKI